MTVNAHDEILRSTVRLARLSFGAAAASVFLYNHEHDTLVFEASSGEGEDRLIGTAIRSDQGIAGWVANTGEPLVVRGVGDDPRFDRAFAAGTGLVPDIIMAAPIEHNGDLLGVLEVLDPRLDTIGDMVAIDLLTELANHSCAALCLLLADRQALARRASVTGPMAILDSILDGGGPGRAVAVDDLLSALARLVR